MKQARMEASKEVREQGRMEFSYEGMKGRRKEERNEASEEGSKKGWLRGETKGGKIKRRQ